MNWTFVGLRANEVVAVAATVVVVSLRLGANSAFQILLKTMPLVGHSAFRTLLLGP